MKSVVKMASGFLPEIKEAFHELFEDSDSKEECEGFVLDDLDENRDEISRAESFSMDNWAESERDPVDLNFASYAHCTQSIDDSFEPVDFFFFFHLDIVQIAEAYAAVVTF